jgi:hypothetical protein
MQYAPARNCCSATTNPYARKETAVKTTMLQLVLVLFLALWGTTTRADEPPPVPEGGINFVIEGKYTDHETGAEGECYGGYGTDGTFYLTFWQNGVMMFIRQKKGNAPYETVWTNAVFMGV